VCAPWPKATVKSPVGACNLRPLFYIFSYFLLFIFLLPWTPCPSLPCPCPALAPALFRIFLLLPGTGGGSYIFFPSGRFCAFGFRDSWRWSQVRRFACGWDGWNVRPAGWMMVRAGGVRGCFIFIPKSLHI
jgi:hypothetical protein